MNLENEFGIQPENVSQSKAGEPHIFSASQEEIEPRAMRASHEKTEPRAMRASHEKTEPHLCEASRSSSEIWKENASRILSKIHEVGASQPFAENHKGCTSRITSETQPKSASRSSNENHTKPASRISSEIRIRNASQLDSEIHPEVASQDLTETQHPIASRLQRETQSNAAIMVNISDLVFDSTIYPRVDVRWFTVYQYTKAMQAGVTFPPILVGLYKGQLYVIDGWHRVEATKSLKETQIQAIIEKFKTKKAMFVRSIELNVSHGLQPTTEEKKIMAYRLTKMKYPPLKISSLLGIPQDDLSSFLKTVIEMPDGRIINIRPSLHEAFRKARTPEHDIPRIVEIVNQHELTVRTIKSLFRQLLEVLKVENLLEEDLEIRKMASELHAVLEGALVLGDAT